MIAISNLPSIGEAPPDVSKLHNFKMALMRSAGQVKSSDLEVTGISEYKQAVVPIMSEEDEIIAGEFTSSEEEISEPAEEVGLPEETAPSDQQRMMRVNKPENTDPVYLLTNYLNHTQPKEDVRLTGNFGKLSFKAVNVSINDFGVAFIIKKDAMQFEPNINTELTVVYRSNNYKVIYAGGFFTFSNIPFTFISFLRVSEE